MKDCFKNNSNREVDATKYCECVLYKENIDTIQAVNLIAKHLRYSLYFCFSIGIRYLGIAIFLILKIRINVKRVGYAGTKDKKAKTSQRISFFK